MIQRLVLLAALALTATCGKSSDLLTAPSNATVVVAKANYSFTPAWTAVPQGSTVTFTFEGVAHAPTFSGVLGSPPNISSTANASVQRTFGTKGQFNYTCSIHPFMTGRITVQ